MSIFFELARKMGNRLGNKDHPPDKFLLPQMNFGHESGDVKVFRKLILRGRLAPFYPGFEDSDAAPGLEECPICCLYFRVMNKTKCCRQRICSECIAQIQISAGQSLSSCPCPFCKKSGIQVEVCGGKTDFEKEVDRIEEQKFTEFCIRERGISLETTPPTNSPQTTPIPVPARPSPLGESSSVPPRRPQVPTIGQSGPRPEFRPIMQSPEDEGIFNPHLSNLEMQHCSEILGICPNDLGMQLEEFNELLLEHTLISSMMDARTAQGAQIDQNLSPQNPRSGGNSSRQASSNEDGTDESVEALVQHLTSSSLFSTSSSSDASQNSTPQQNSEEGSSSNSSSDTSSGSSDNYGSVWGNFLNSLVGIGERNFQLRTIFVQFDDPQLNQQTVDEGPTNHQGQSSSSLDFTFFEETQESSDSSKSTIAVQNPDGSLAVVYSERKESTGESEELNKAPEEQSKDQIYTTPEDAAIIDATREADERQRQAIDSADERLRRLFNP